MFYLLVPLSPQLLNFREYAMANIKSAIELAMERTKDLVMDEAERKALAAKELKSKIKAVARRYVEGIIESDGVVKEVNKISGDKGLKRSMLMDILIDEFDVKEKNERLFELVRVIGCGLQEPFKHELEEMQKAFAEEMARSELKVREKITDRLREMGITGSGVEPNIEEWDEWRESAETAGNLFKGHFVEWKDRLRAANSCEDR